MPSIGKLNVAIMASTDQFEKAIKNAERTLGSFTAKATAPLTSIKGGLAGLGGLGSLMTGGILNPAMGLAKMLPGGEIATYTMGIEKAIAASDKAVDRVGELTAQSQALGVSPKFLRAMEMQAGVFGDQVPGMLMRAEKFISKLAAGEDDLGRSTSGLSKRFNEFMAGGGLSGSTTREEKLKKLLDFVHQMPAGLQKSQAEFDIFGKSGLAADSLVKGPKEIQAALDAAEKLGYGDEKLMGNVSAIRGMRRYESRFKEGLELKATGAGLFAESSKWEWNFGSPKTAVVDYARSWLASIFGTVDEERQNFLQAKWAKKASQLLPEEEKRNAEEADRKLYAQGDAYDAAFAASEKSINLSIQQNKLAAKMFGKAPWETQLESMRIAGQDPGKIAAQEKSFQQLDALTASRTPLSKLQDALSNVARNDQFTPGGRDRANYDILNSAIGFDAMVKRSTGAAKFIEAGSQAQYALTDALQGQGEESQVKIGVDQVRDAIRAMADRESQQLESIRSVLDDVSRNGPSLVNFPLS